MDDNTFFEEADNDDCPMEDPLRGPKQERPEDSQAIFELESGCLTDLPVMLTESDKVRHFSVYMDSDPFTDDTFYLMMIEENDGNIHCGFMQADPVETHDWSTIAAVVDEIINHGCSTDFNIVYTAESLFYAEEDWEDMTNIIRMEGIGVLQAYSEALEDWSETDSLY